MCHRSFDLHYHSISQRGDELPALKDSGRWFWIQSGMLSRVFLLLQPSFTGNKFRLDIHSLKRKKKATRPITLTFLWVVSGLFSVAFWKLVVFYIILCVYNLTLGAGAHCELTHSSYSWTLLPLQAQLTCRWSDFLTFWLPPGGTGTHRPCSAGAAHPSPRLWAAPRHPVQLEAGNTRNAFETAGIHGK